jgi:hypothetical protein
VTIILSFLISYDIKPFLSFEMLFALIYIEAKRDPEKMVTVWFVTTKSNFYIILDMYVPWVLMLFSMITGGDIISDLVGIAAGHLYFFFKDLAPLNFGWDILKTPHFMINYFDRGNVRNYAVSGQPQSQPQPSFRSLNNQNSSGTFGGQSQPSSTLRQEGAEGSGNRFRPFGGSGTTWG